MLATAESPLSQHANLESIVNYCPTDLTSPHLPLIRCHWCPACALLVLVLVLVVLPLVLALVRTLPLGD